MTAQPLLLDLSRFRRIASSLSLMVAGPLVILGILVTPYPDDATAIARDPLRTQLAADLLFVGYLLIVPGIFAMLRLAGQRGAVLAHVGTVLALYGWITLPGLVLGDFYELDNAQNLGARQAESLSSHIGDYPGFLAVAAPAKYAAGLGLILIAAALWRAKAVRWWEVAPIILWFVTLVGLRGRAVESIELVASVLLSFSLISIGLRALRAAPDSDSVPGGLSRSSHEVQASGA
jgi:hypothetical protein